MSPGATVSGTPSTVSVTAKPVTCTSFDTVLLRVGVKMPTALAARRTPKGTVARGPSLIPLPTVPRSPASPRRVEAVHRRNAGIRRAHACIVHVGRLSRTSSVSLIGRPSSRPGVQIVVLGAKGSIGGAVVRRARFAGQHVRAVVRPSTGQDRFPAGVEVVHADLQSKESVVAAARGADLVVHAANVPYPDWPRLVPRFAENALTAAEAAGATLAFPGNVYVYGHPRSRPVTEDHPQEPHTVKGRLRVRIEQLFLQAHRDRRGRRLLPPYPGFYRPPSMAPMLPPSFHGAPARQPRRAP